MTMKGTLYLFGIAAWCYVVSGMFVPYSCGEGGGERYRHDCQEP